MKTSKHNKTIIITVITSVAVILGFVSTFYAINSENFNPVELVDNLIYGEKRSTEPPTQPPTEPSTTLPEIKAKISEQILSITDNTTAQIIAEVTGGEKSKYNIRYTTSDENIASIDTKGIITPMSKGECQVGVYVEGYDTTIRNFNVTVDDYRINQINILNSYLFGLSSKENYTYSGNKRGIAKLTGCRIGDFNNDGYYELFIKYNMADDFQKIIVVTTDGENYYVNQTEKNYSDIVSSGYSSYIENVYIDVNGNISIISEYTKYISDYSEKTTLLYSTGVGAVQQAKYYCKEPLKLSDITKKSVYQIDDEKKERDDFTMLYTSLKSAREIFDDYISITASLSQGNYVKAELPSDIGSSYYNRLLWTSSDEDIAKVNNTGMITGGSKAGTCEIIGYINGMDIPFCKITVDVSDISNEFDGYVESIKDTDIIGVAGNKMRLYGYYVTDLDNDGSTDLLLYYVGGNGCQLEMAHYIGSQVSRKVIKSTVTENGTSCLLDLYTDIMNNEIVLYVGKVTKTNSSLITEFHYENFINGEFIDNNSSKYTINSKTSGSSEYQVAGEDVEETNFNNMLNRYTKFGSWKLV